MAEPVGDSYERPLVNCGAILNSPEGEHLPTYPWTGEGEGEKNTLRT